VEIKRFVYKDLQRELQEPEVLILVGPRQVGKTTLLRQLEADARGAGLRTRYLDLEQPADLAFLGGRPGHHPGKADARDPTTLRESSGRKRARGLLAGTPSLNP